MSLYLLLQIQTHTLPLSVTHTYSLSSLPLASRPYPASLLPTRLFPTSPRRGGSTPWSSRHGWGTRRGLSPSWGTERTETLQSCPGNVLPRPINKETLFAFSLSGPVQIFTAPVTRGGSTGSGGREAAALQGVTGVGGICLAPAPGISSLCTTVAISREY